MTVLCTGCRRPVDSRIAALVDHGTGYLCGACRPVPESRAAVRDAGSALGYLIGLFRGT